MRTQSFLRVFRFITLTFLLQINITDTNNLKNEMVRVEVKILVWPYGIDLICSTYRS